ncbi:MAG TPA: hypothetical protein PK331_05135 [Gordonia sp. (in: high G+C Gram-positive bacteria)]|uniref:hypothetical protein n=1 Tax=unclassified Gordonia (in: high G+C Gram-positive bacteria) TaxID=2657482 RepID=UPI000F9FF618|nr:MULTISPECIES: hypothetical protein [unclassified Gordonia (in: high G+C Gram-positive bacteria)]RUP41538.1 MAG: hypothetical protein EKK60_00505 [Gordonia sp. (in: high G+C Gram-positive bacteria)]HNP56624.1 hypothetical protein [Gordonia sp. (in: high G+C Gram-positive bacteria)]HRC50294.1 hypothetical protein [Gordonia sp. (in: high G+C Gram-positive bacteria)]
MTDQITIGSTTESGSRRWVAGVVAAVGAVAVLTGCTVSGTPSAPPQAVAQYKAEQVVKRQKANAQQVCLTIPVTMRQSVDVYNSMIRAYNASGNLDTNLVNQTLARIDQDLTALRAANEKDLPADLKTQLGKMITAREAQRAAVASRNISSMNSTAREMNSARDQFTALCKTYL